MVAISFPPNIKDIHTQFSTNGLSCPDAPLCKTNLAKATTAYDRIAIWNDPSHPGHNPQELIDAGTTPEAFTALAKSLLKNKVALGDMDDHINGLPDVLPGAPGSLGTENLIKNLGTAQMHKTMTDTLGTTLASDPCGVTQALMGAVSGAAGPLLSAADAALQSVLDVVANGISAVVSALATTIADAISALDDATGGMLSMIADELSEFAKVAAEALTFAQSLGLANLYNNPCSKAILDTVAPPGLKSAMSTAVSYLD